MHLSVAATVTDASGEEPENGTFQAGETGILHIHATFDDFLDGSETHTISVYAPTGFSILTIDEPGLPSGVPLIESGRSDERRVGKEWGSTGRAQGSTDR